MIELLYSIMPIFLVISLGYALRRTFLSSVEFWLGLEKLSFFVLFPSLLFRYTARGNFTNLSSSNHIHAILGLVAITILICFVIKIYYEKFDTISSKSITSVYQGAIRYNSYLLFGITSSLYKDEGLVAASILSAYMMIFTNKISIIAFNFYATDSNKNNIYYDLFIRFITNPIVLASAFGLVCNYSQIELHISLDKFLDILADAALGIGVITVGANLNLFISNYDVKPILYSCALKLILMPICTCIIFKLLNITGVLYKVAILYSALPTATSSTILSRQLGGDTELMASIVTISILISIITIPIMLLILT